MSEFLSENFVFFCGKIFSIFEEACFRNDVPYRDGEGQNVFSPDPLSGSSAGQFVVFFVSDIS